MYVLLCGKLPFDDDHIPSLFKKIESGIYSMPSHVSKEAQHVLRRMLVVDPVKRATINEIRQMPFFTENLPNYLQPLPATPMTERYPTLPMGDLSTLLLINEGQADPKKIAEAKGLTWTEDLGIIDPDIVDELLQKISTYTPEMVKDALQKPGDNQVKVAYQLVRDHKQIVRDCELCKRRPQLTRPALYSFDDEDQSAMEDFLASSPPAWNAEIPHHQQPHAEDENDLDEVDPEIQDIPNAHFDVLDSSLPGKSTPPGGETREQEDAERAARALLSPPEPPIPTFETKPLQKPRWHFGIRSRSPPMEVLLEIYRVLQQIGMEWKLKDVPLPEIGPVPPGGQGYTEEVDDALARYQAENPDKEVVMGKRPPGKKEAAAIEKAAQSLFLIETRARYDNTLIRMDLQLFYVDNSNCEWHAVVEVATTDTPVLVDFRNVSYTPVPPTDGEEPTRPKGAAIGGGGVSGPFQFLEMACQLIAELASG